MVACQRLSVEPKEQNQNQNTDESDFEDASDTTSIQNDLEVYPSSEPTGNFGNIVVKNSADVHFGNKTFYQGPVTIKQFLYNNSSSDSNFPLENGHENPVLSTDSVCSVGNGNNEINNGISQQRDIPTDRGW